MDGRLIPGAPRALLMACFLFVPLLAGCQGEPPSNKNGLPPFQSPGGLAEYREFLVKLKTGPGLTSVRAALRAEHDEDSEAVREDLLLVRFPEGSDASGRVENLLQNPAVEYIEPNYEVSLLQGAGVLGRPNDPYLHLQWAHETVKSAEAWDVGVGSAELIVGVIDTGIDYEHPDLKENIWKNPRETAGNGKDDDGNGLVDDVYGWNFANWNNRPMADDLPAYHGTHVSGTVGAVGNNGTGVSGHAHRVKLMALKFLKADGKGDIANAIRAIDYAVSKGAKILNNSWGAYDRSQALSDAIERARSKGVLFVAAAGNGGQDGAGDNNDSVPVYPASFPHDNIVSVAATGQSDRLTSFSNFGRTSVDVAAPGEDIYSTQNAGHYGYLSGTSMATPLVSGVAALVWGQNRALTYKDVRRILIETSDPVSALNDKLAANGRINAAKAIRAAGGSNPDPNPDPTPDPNPDPNPNPNPDPNPNPNPDPDPVPQPGGKARAPTLNGQVQLRVQNPYLPVQIAYNVAEFQGAAGVYFEVSRPNVGFSNPNGNAPDPSRLTFLYGQGVQNSTILIPVQGLPGWGSYSMRVIPLDAQGRAVGVFSDASVLHLWP